MKIEIIKGEESLILDAPKISVKPPSNGHYILRAIMDADCLPGEGIEINVAGKDAVYTVNRMQVMSTKVRYIRPYVRKQTAKLVHMPEQQRRMPINIHRRQYREIVCELCKKKFKIVTMGHHLKSTHNITWVDYQRKYMSKDLEVIKKKVTEKRGTSGMGRIPIWTVIQRILGPGPLMVEAMERIIKQERDVNRTSIYSALYNHPDVFKKNQDGKWEVHA